MSWRVVVIQKRSKLDSKMGYLVIRNDDIHRVFLDEIAVLIIENPAVSITGCLLNDLVEKKIKVIFCDDRHNPISQLVPSHGSFDDSRKIRTQIAWDETTKGYVWTSIIAEKIRQQAILLSDNGKERESDMLYEYISQLRYYDETNREGHSAKVYFNALFGMSFKRTESSPINAMLNYGYSILLSAFNREVESSGYLTQLGVFHDNVLNHFNLSSDLMEPFRPLSDREVVKAIPETFGTEQHRIMQNILNKTVIISGSNQTVLNAIRIYCRSVFHALNENDAGLIEFFEITDNEL